MIHGFTELEAPWRQRGLFLAALAVLCGNAQTPPAPASEITTREAPVTFRSRVNLVTVPVVVRDSKRQAIGDLEKEDFQLLDGGKPQIVSRFSVEKPGLQEPSPPALEVPAAAGVPPAAAPLNMPQRFVALVIDDLHTEFADLVWTRQAVEKFLASSAGPAERVAIYASSGKTAVDFTNDRDQLTKGLLAIQSGVKPTPIARRLLFTWPTRSRTMTIPTCST